MPTQSTTILQLFESLRGTWQLQRHLGTQGHMQGVAYFRPYGEGILHYQEEGKATLGPGNTFAAHREYAYVYDQGTIAVCFWDKKQQQPARLLHPLQFYIPQATDPPLMATGTHKCADDRYQAHYRFVNPKQFRLTYQVKGPRKDYVLTSYFSKMMNNIL